MNRFATALLVVLSVVTLTSCAQDGGLRERLKERRAQREAAKAPAASTVTASAGTRRYTLQHGGHERHYLVHVPARLDPSRPAPMLVALHGGGGNMDHQADDARYGLLSLAEREGYVLVVPNGHSQRRNGGLATWNAGQCCGNARDEGIDDVGFIRQVVERVAGSLNVDRRRIYATGMSNGGMMAYRLACEAGDLFAAVAPVAGTDNTRSCTPSKAVSVLHIHARNDSHVRFEGGAGPDAVRASLITDFVSVPDTVAKWARLNACTAPAKPVLERPGARCERHAACRDGSEVQLCVTESGGHSWPGGHKARGEAPSTALSANDTMAEFFRRH